MGVFENSRYLIASIYLVLTAFPLRAQGTLILASGVTVSPAAPTVGQAESRSKGDVCKT